MPDPGPVAALERVTVRYGAGAPALDGIDLQIRRGEILGIVGESGAGKSTLLRLLDADETPSEGTVLIEGADPSAMRERERRGLRRRIGMVFQSFNLLANRTARQNVELPLRLQRRKDPAFVDELLDYVGLGDRGGDYPAQLSGGQKQRVAIARALVTRPPLLLCDEPTSALDERTTSDILRLLASTREDFGTTIALVTHELAAVKAICDRAAILDRGRLQGIVSVEHSARDDRGSYAEHAKRMLES
ncbi:metal ABC transporter ATP-binding protein [Pseudoclavibacter sp. RFBJ3]|uniref:methionine ABC transporter ATP-binding protein n=1 Tax=unclassified Pseudoclavibacter TaxID=2615177 RepID=UPI000CE8C319|nr:MULTISPECIES: ATP-binding cassette domain-containing protein [unclassified Pseudoclavibacter]PPF36571.1 metal ABC transporter ATP-binding protein [Pseudoclavibacter sp. AY1H1]PPF74534.1 metal ABC transporter ATP-binding protein [Pseudoclavibacter sp. Z016]PPF82565.1 metal ABC transporter ATP-binding protein [Pseudoclavibacter sp. RFBJ5]PPF91459.1 metal ABC transporter ATP-binding protein [Pseudoclavibacter sp. RFBJ3]PPF96383.1 metal ABC transporter ATP-binding protein [Pseudoclavibacter sp.